MRSSNGGLVVSDCVMLNWLEYAADYVTHHFHSFELPRWHVPHLGWVVYDRLRNADLTDHVVRQM